jgi:zinc transporter 1/2/3
MVLEPVHLKYIGAAAIFLSVVIGSVCPVFVTAPKWTARAESLAGGVFLGAGLAHLLADATEELEAVSRYPLAPAVAAGVFVLFTCIELFSYSEHDEAVFAEEHHHQRDAPRGPDIYATLPEIDASGAPSISQPLPRRIVEFGHDMSGFNAATVSLYLIMNMHSAIEALALGVLEKWSDIIAIMCAIVAHKPVEAFALGLILLKRRPTLRAFALMIALYCALAPVGVVIGIVLRNQGNRLAIGLIEAFSAGAFLFIGCHEWSEMFEHKHEWQLSEKLWHFGVFFAGVAWMLGIAAIEMLTSE